MLNFWDIYSAERNKLTRLPCADADFEALDNAIKISAEKEGKCERPLSLRNLLSAKEVIRIK